MQNITTIKQPEKKEKVLMPDGPKELLKKLYTIRSYSGFEEPLRRALMDYLNNLKIPYMNYNGNLLGFNHPGKPLFSAHLDMVNTEGYKLKYDESEVEDPHFTIDSKACIRLYRDAEHKQQTSLGADDKNGVWVILMLLAAGYEINFAFCHSEEVGGTGSKQIIDDKDCASFISSCQYGVVIDRRNAGDIIGYDNKYCMGLDDRLHAFSTELKAGYKPATGSISDADRFANLIECVNLSCGYYEPHSSREYTNLNELYNTYMFCRKMLDEFVYHSVSTDRMKKFRGVTTSTTTSSYYSNKSYYDTSTYNEYWKKKDADLKTEKKISEENTSLATTTSTTVGTKDQWDKEDVALAIENGYSFSFDTNDVLIPLTVHNKKNAKDMLEVFCCNKCKKKIGISLSTVDDLYEATYSSKIGDVYGVCPVCHTIDKITDHVVKWI